jgi:hypothetical protein
MRPTLTFTVVEPRGIEHPMIAGQVARLTDQPILGSLNSLRGQLVVIEDAHRHNTDGPLWLTILGTTRSDATMRPGTPVQCVMRADETDRLIAEWLPGTIRARQCLSMEHIDRRSCYVVTHSPLGGESITVHVDGPAERAASHAWAMYDEHTTPTLIPTAR